MWSTLSVPTAAGDSTEILGVLVVAATAIVSVILVVVCVKKKKPRSHVTAPQNSEDGNVSYGSATPIESPTIYDDVATDTTQKAPSTKTSDWTKVLDQKAIGGARSQKEVKKKPKKKSRDIFPEKEDFGFDGADNQSSNNDSLAAVNPISISPNQESPYNGFAAVEDPRPGTSAPEDNLSGFDGPDGDTDGEQDEVVVGEDVVPAWYAGKLSRDLCIEAVTSANDGDFLVRESSRGDRCVICINDRGKSINLVVQVTPDKKYRFAGKERDSLNDVIFFLRRRPLKSSDSDGHTVNLSMPAPKENAIRKDREQHASLDADDLNQEVARMQELSRGGQSAPSVPDDSFGTIVIGTDGMDMYQSVTVQGLGRNSSYIDDPFVDESGIEPLYVDMHDANVPSFDFIAEKEEEHRLEQAGNRRMTNEEFAKIRLAAKVRAQTAAELNRQKLMQRSVRQRWRNLPSISSTVPLPPRPAHLQKEEEENFASYEDASAREFGGYDEDEIYESVPRWFAGRLDRKKCEEIIKQNPNGAYLCRESSSGDKYIVCLKHQGVVKNFQIYIRGASTFEFSGRQYQTLDAVMSHITAKGILKKGERIPLTQVAEW